MILKECEFTCIRDGLAIRGTTIRPEGDCLPAVIISHGFTDNRKHVIKYVRQFAEWGYAAFCFDFNGGCAQGESEGLTTQMSVLTEVEDLRVVMDYVQEQPDVDASRLILMGCSQGGFVSALAAARWKREVWKLLLFYPALCIPDDARRGKMMKAVFDPANIPDTIDCGGFRLGRIYPESVMDMNPYEEIKSYQGSVLIVHGAEDGIVPVDYVRRALDAYNGTGDGDAYMVSGVHLEEEHVSGSKVGQCQLLILEGAKHGFTPEEDENALKAVLEFLQGRQEVLAIDVRLTGRSLTVDGEETVTVLTFDGSGAGSFFTGIILPGAADTQRRKGGEPVRFCADYTLEGVDFTGRKCRVHIVNTFNGNAWKPVLDTDSITLGFLNGADCSAWLEGRRKGPVVHIYARIPDNSRRLTSYCDRTSADC